MPASSAAATRRAASSRTTRRTRSQARCTGALIAVPLTAVVNAVVTHLAAYTGPSADPVEELAEDYEEQESTEPVEDKSNVSD